MTPLQIKRWLKSANPNDRITYRTGKQLSASPKRHDYSDAVHLIRHYYNLGYVDLVQRRAPNSFFEYIAVRKGEIGPPLPTHRKSGVATHLFVIPDRIAAEG